MNNVNYLLLYKGNSGKGGYESSVRAFVTLEAARRHANSAHPIKVLNDISQLLQDNGYEAASKFLDCSFEL